LLRHYAPARDKLQNEPFNKTIAMAIDPQEKRTKNYVLMRSVMDYGMGLVIVCCGIFFAIAPKLGIEFNVDPFFRYFFAVMCIVYGGWRIYRGYLKNYYQDEK
jgi:hypothetical protein